jgi:hypothetical protein
VEPDDSFMGGLPPVHITTNGCGEVTVNVRFVFESREHDTLRKCAEMINLAMEEECQKILK